MTKSELLNNYYYDEFIVMMDAYNDMHSLDRDKNGGDREVYADELD